MSTIQEIIAVALLGILQGISEFLPISSTAHLGIASLAMGGDIGIFATNLISLGTTGALVTYFWSDCKALIRSKTIVKDIFHITLATLPIIALYLLVKNQVDSLFRSVYFFGIFLIIGGVLLLIAEYVHRSKLKTNPPKNQSTLSWSDYLLIGCFQSLAIFPGMSRSGSTLSGGLLLGKERGLTVRTSFWLSMPAFVLAGVYSLYSLLKQPVPPPLFSSNYSISNVSWIAIMAGTLTAYITGYYALKWLIPYLSRYSSVYFVIYRIVVGALLVAYSIVVY